MARKDRTGNRRPRDQRVVKRVPEMTAYEAQYRIPWIVFDRDQVQNFDEIISDAKRPESTWDGQIRALRYGCTLILAVCLRFRNRGCAYGKFYDFEFTTNKFFETTTIGYAANFAAKIQSKTRAGRISISENIYEELGQEDRDKFEKVLDDSMNKYNQDGYWRFTIETSVLKTKRLKCTHRRRKNASGCLE